MRIQYFGEQYDEVVGKLSRNAVISFKKREIDTADKIEDALRDAGYKPVFRWGDDNDDVYETTYSVEDREDYENLKDIYLETKNRLKK